MRIITNANDVLIWVTEHIGRDATTADCKVVFDYICADNHPRWGTDWSDYLANVPEMVTIILPVLGTQLAKPETVQKFQLWIRTHGHNVWKCVGFFDTNSEAWEEFYFEWRDDGRNEAKVTAVTEYREKE